MNPGISLNDGPQHMANLQIFGQAQLRFPSLWSTDRPSTHAPQTLTREDTSGTTLWLFSEAESWVRKLSSKRPPEWSYSKSLVNLGKMSKFQEKCNSSKLTQEEMENVSRLPTLK